MKIKETIDKIINVSDSDYTKLVNLIDDFKIKRNESIFVTSLINEYTVSFSRILKDMINKSFDNKLKLIINVLMNPDAKSFFGLYTMTDNETLHKLLFTLNDNAVKYMRLDIEIDTKIFDKLDSDTIAQAIITELTINIFDDYSRALYQSMMYKLSLDKLAIQVHHTNEEIADLYGTIYSSFNNSIFKIARYEDSDKKDFLLPEVYDVVSLINNQISKEDYGYDEQFIATFGKFDLQKYIYKLLVSNDGDPYMHKRLEILRDSTELKLLKRYCESWLNKLNTEYNYKTLLKEHSTLLPMNSHLLSEGFIDSMKAKQKARKEKSKLKNFNNVYGLYYNRFFELQIQLKHLKDEYNTLIYIRDVNKIINILNDYKLADKLSPEQKNKLDELYNMYIGLRLEATKKNIPKYSNLSIWTPMDVKDNPYA